MAELTARQITERILQHTGVDPLEYTVDTFNSGNPDLPVKGVAVTMMPTLQVLHSAVEQGCNFIIAHEPAFYGHLDDTSELEREGDSVWKAKRDFIEQHQLVLWRFHDYPHCESPDAILAGMVEELNWRDFQREDNDSLFVLPPTTLLELARHLQQRLSAQTVRVVGAGDLAVSKIALSPGFPGFDSQRHLLQNEEVQVLVMGEAHEWETIAYAADAVAAKQHKALIVLGHIPSEQGGMRAYAHRIARLLPDTTVKFIPTPEPFWSPVPTIKPHASSNWGGELAVSVFSALPLLKP